MAAVHTVFDLCAQPHYLAPLRAEVREALRRHGNKWSMDVVKQFPLLDSFIKESQRLNSPSFCKFAPKSVEACPDVKQVGFNRTARKSKLARRSACLLA